MFYYTEKIWAWLAIQSLRVKFYTMMAVSQGFTTLYQMVHIVNRAGLWIETKLLKASAFFFKNS